MPKNADGSVTRGTGGGRPAGSVKPAGRGANAPGWPSSGGSKARTNNPKGTVVPKKSS